MTKRPTLPWFGAIALLAAAGAGPADAQDREQARIAHAVRLTHSFARCLVDRARPKVVDVLEREAGSLAERQAFGALSRRRWSHCYELVGREDSILSVPHVVMRGPLAEALYEEDFTPAGAPRGRTLARLPDPAVVGSSGYAPGPVTRLARVGAFAACVVEARPAESVALLATEPQSPAEQGVIDRLVPIFSSCYPAGAQLQINYPLFRGFLAESVYRRAAAASTAETARP